MKNQNTPKPDPVPKFRSSTDHRSDKELPGVENMNDQVKAPQAAVDDTPKPELGNDRKDDEDEREKLITP